MKLPNPLRFSHVYHKAGGTITVINGIDHSIEKPEDGRSRDTWWFIGDVTWNDKSGESKDTEIMAYHLCTDTEEGKQEIEQAMKAMNFYLEANGKWGPEGWTAKRQTKKPKALTARQKKIASSTNNELSRRLRDIFGK